MLADKFQKLIFITKAIALEVCMEFELYDFSSV